MRQRIFISVANSEFAPLRAMLRDAFTRAGFDVVVQPDFPQTDADTVRKLDLLIAECQLVVHIVGQDSGSRAAVKAVVDFFAHQSRDGFMPSVADRGFFDTLTYVQWEPWLALQRGIPVFVYGTPGHDAPMFPHRVHLDALRGERRFAETLWDTEQRIGQILADVGRHFHIAPLAPTPTPTTTHAVPKILRHAPRILFGREAWLAKLDDAWIGGHINVYTLVAWGGVGKTSLVANWVNERFAKHGWPGVERYFDWSFYSQGTGESRQTSADLFINEALKFFGDADPTKGDPWQKGERLAGLIRQHRTLLVLDGIEPLQYPPNDQSGLGGQLKDPALATLVQSLAANNPGLCVITTREHLKNVENYGRSEEVTLERLFREAAIAFLRHLQIVGTDDELAEASELVDGHALTLQLLGRFIADAYPDKDIRHHRQVQFAEADKFRHGRSAFKVMKAYEKWLANNDADKQRELAILRLSGLFDRPISKGCMDALRAEPAIPKLTEELVGIRESHWNIALSRLISVDLLSRSPDEALDAHPIVREYFEDQLKREMPETFKAAHSRLFDYLCENTPHRPDNLEGLAPLFQAVVHGCHAGKYQEACDNVYIDRILRGTGDDGFHSARQLGAIGADLGAVAAFFDELWSKVTVNLRDADQALLLSCAGYCLRALGRLTEALQPMWASLQHEIALEDWKNAADRASNLSRLERTLGKIEQAYDGGLRSVEYADKSGDIFQKMDCRTTVADALHDGGRRIDAERYYADAEQMLVEVQRANPSLAFGRGFRYVDFLLAPAERMAWQEVSQTNESQRSSASVSEVNQTWKLVFGRGEQMQQHLCEGGLGRLSVGHIHLTLARTKLYRVLCHIDSLPDPNQRITECDDALSKMREANQLHHLPKALLTCGLYYGGLLGDHIAAKRYLDEAEQIALRGPMPLYLADVHLHRARLFRDTSELAKAERLIDKHGYGRRKEELADAKEALGVA